MASPSIITGPRCRFCPRIVPDSIAHLFGDPLNGYMCPDCVITEQAKQQAYSRSLAEDAEIEIKVPMKGSPHGCAICGSVDSRHYLLVYIDNAKGQICVVPGKPMLSLCERKYAEKNREKYGPAHQFILKLK